MTIALGAETYHAWTFTHLLPGEFERDKKDFAGMKFPILAPIPVRAAKTKPYEGGHLEGPFLYFVIDGSDRLCYIGKTEEDKLFRRWIRPGIGGPASHYWSHATKDGGSIARIAEGLQRGEGPFTLRYAPLDELLPALSSTLNVSPGLAKPRALVSLERALINKHQPLWNRR